MIRTIGQAPSQRVGRWAGIGAVFGAGAALVVGAELPIAIVFGATVALIVGLAVDALTPPDPRDHADPRHPLASR